MDKVLLLLLVLAVALALGMLLTRQRRGGGDPAALRDARAGHLAAEQAVITRQGGQGMGQGGIGGGLGG